MKIFIESFIGKFIVAFIVATFAVALCIRYDVSDSVVVLTYLSVGILTMLALGAFDERDRKDTKYDSIHKTGQNYGQAAIFIGTACLFIGDPDECGELADSLQHYAQQAKARALKGDETFETFEVL